MPEFENRFVNKQWDDYLADRLEAQSQAITHTTKAELVAYYQGKQARKEVKSWRKALVHDLAAITGLKEKNLQRRFDPSRLNKTPSKKNAEEYAKLGERIGITGYTAPEKGFYIQWSAKVFISNKAYTKSSQVAFVGSAAQNLVDDAKWWKIVQAYFTPPDGLKVVEDVEDIDPDGESPVTGLLTVHYLVVNGETDEEYAGRPA